MLGEDLLSDRHVGFVGALELEEVIPPGRDNRLGNRLLAKHRVAGESGDGGIMGENVPNRAFQGGQLVFLGSNGLLPDNAPDPADKDRKDVIVGAAQGLSVDVGHMAWGGSSGNSEKTPRFLPMNHHHLIHNIKCHFQEILTGYRNSQKNRCVGHGGRG